MVRLIAARLLPLVLITVAAAAWFNDVQDGGPHVVRNFVPLIMRANSMPVRLTARPSLQTRLNPTSRF